MRLKDYIHVKEKCYYNISDKNRKKILDETIDFTTNLKKIKDGISQIEYIYKVNNDIYKVYIGRLSIDVYDVSYGSVTGDNDEITTRLTHKNVPFKVLDGVATAIKKLIEDENPRQIIFSIISSKKKVDVFYNTIKTIIKRKLDLFGSYKISKKNMTSIDDILLGSDKKAVNIILTKEG